MAARAVVVFRVSPLVSVHAGLHRISRTGPADVATPFILCLSVDFEDQFVVVCLARHFVVERDGVTHGGRVGEGQTSVGVVADGTGFCAVHPLVRTCGDNRPRGARVVLPAHVREVAGLPVFGQGTDFHGQEVLHAVVVDV